jgi:F-type H+-transporting ATPase subunit delta
MPALGSGARRYAEAMLGLARDERAVDAFRASLERLARALDRETVAMLRDPGIPLARREEAVAAATKDEPVEIRSLLRLLLERDRIGVVGDIARVFGDLVDEREGIAKARITTAVELDEREQSEVVRELERASGRRIRATFAVDPALIGGAKVQVGDHLIDASLDARLRALGRQLASQS